MAVVGGPRHSRKSRDMMVKGNISPGQIGKMFNANQPLKRGWLPSPV